MCSWGRDNIERRQNQGEDIELLNNNFETVE